jgi:sugar/nucleoside kinase (ribokinase family)
MSGGGRAATAALAAALLGVACVALCLVVGDGDHGLESSVPVTVVVDGSR